MYLRRLRRQLPIVLAAAVLIGGAAGAAGQSASTTPILVDRDLSPAAGATITLGVGRIVAQAEDRLVPLRLFEERGKLRRTANAGYRLAKLFLFDQPQENWLRVANHEVFGHGGRIRELFDDGHISYELPAPPPYGRGGGATFFEYTHPPTVEEALAVSVGGMEANEMLGAAMAKDALTAGDWDYRDARRYLYAEYDTIRYIRGVHDVEPEGHDVGDFLRIYNDVAASEGEKTLSARTLRHRVLASFANPLIAYSYYSTFVSYVWGGHTRAPVPMLHVGATRYLPMARFQLTPFGTEWTIDNTFVRNGHFADATLYVGQTIGARTWGVGVQGTRLATVRHWTVDGHMVVWHRPDWGGEIAAMAQRDLARLRHGPHGLALVVQGGVKTNGFLAGDPLAQGGFVRIGAALTTP